MRGLDPSAAFLSSFSFPGSDRRNLVALGVVFIAVFFLIGCASQRGVVSEADYLSLLPEDAEIYLRFPARENQGIASRLIASFVPSMEERDIERLQKRFDCIYASVKDSELSAIATGSFPKAGLGFVLKEKNGWQKIKEDAVPVTGLYYQYQDLPFQIAFPNSSAMMISSRVNELLAAYGEASSLDCYPRTNPLAQFSSEYGQEDLALIQNIDKTSSQSVLTNQTIDFYVADVVSLVVPLLKRKLPVDLPLTDLYGRFTPVEAEKLEVSTESIAGDGKLYAFTGYLGLSDPRAMVPALAALRIVFRVLGLDARYDAFSEDTIKVTGLAVSEKDVVSLLNKSLR